MKNPIYMDFIGVYENIVDPNLCKQLIEYFETSDRWSTMPPAERQLNSVQDQQLVIDGFNKGLSSQVMIPFRQCFQNYIDNNFSIHLTVMYYKPKSLNFQP